MTKSHKHSQTQENEGVLWLQEGVLRLSEGGGSWSQLGGLFSVSSPGEQQADSHTGAQASTTAARQDGDHRVYS